MAEEQSEKKTRATAKSTSKATGEPESKSKTGAKKVVPVKKKPAARKKDTQPKANGAKGEAEKEKKPSKAKQSAAKSKTAKKTAPKKATKAEEKTMASTAEAKQESKPESTGTPFGEFIELEMKDNGVGLAWFDTPGKSVNLLSPDMLDAIESLINHVSENPQIKALVFASRKKDNFIAGADLVSMVQGEFSLERADAFGDKGRQLFQRVAELEVPTIAAIHGTCLGGGTELALACDYRVAAKDKKTKMGLPEVQLGILPAWGGSQRLPRLISLPAALDLMLTGKQIPARKAKSLGLIHLAPPKEILIDTALKLADDILHNQAGYVDKQSAKGGLLDKALNNLAVGQNLVFKQARKGVMDKSKGFYPAPLKILESIQNGINLPLHEAFKLEAQAFHNLLERSETANLMNLFFINQDLGKVPELEDKDISPNKVKNLGVLGAGYMGAGIAQVSNYRGMDIRFKDINYQALLKGMQAINKNYKAVVKRKRLTAKQAEDAMRKITPTTDYTGFHKCDLVIEAIVENMDLKKKVFAEMNEVLNPDCIIASNTSALSINEMAEASGRPDRFIGLHFFGPVHKMPLVEVILGEKTSPQTLATAMGYVKSIGKTPVVIRQDKPGFVVNRILAVYGNEANLLLEEGGDITTLDKLMRDFGMPMGLFEVADLAGIDVAYHTGETVKEIIRDRPGFEESKVMKKLFDDKRFGQKSGKGYYIHTGKEPIPDHRYLEMAVEEVSNREKRQLTAEEMRDRLVLSILNEAALCLEEGLVLKPGEIDMSMIMGTGFPPFRGGPLRLIDQQGIQFIVNQLEYYAETRGERFAPCQLLKDMAAENKKFYPQF